MTHYEYSFLQIRPCALEEAEERFDQIGGEGWKIHTVRYWETFPGAHHTFPGADFTLEREDEQLNKGEKDYEA